MRLSHGEKVSMKFYRPTRWWEFLSSVSWRHKKGNLEMKNLTIQLKSPGTGKKGYLGSKITDIQRTSTWLTTWKEELSQVARFGLKGPAANNAYGALSFCLLTLKGKTPTRHMLALASMPMKECMGKNRKLLSDKQSNGLRKCADENRKIE